MAKVLASASASVLPINIQGWFPLRLTGVISLQSTGSQEYSLAPQFESINFSPLSLLYSPTLTSVYMTTGKTITLTIRTFVRKVMSLLFNMVCRFVKAFLWRSKCFVLFCFNFMAAVTIYCDSGVQENKVCHYFHFSPIYLPWGDGTRCYDLSFLSVEF